jgi:hypothetical protein
VTAEELTKELEQSLSAVQKKYDKQQIEVTGTVRRIEEPNPKGTPPTGGGISLYGFKTSEGISDITVLCTFEVGSPESAVIPGIKLEQKVKIRGSFDNAFEGFISIDRCKLIEPAKPSPAP